jgi:hypothetical protein
MLKLIYHQPRSITGEEAESAFASDDSAVIALALVNVAFYDPDWQWVQEKCVRYTRHYVAAVRQIAVTCLGHVVRIHRYLDLEIVLPVLDQLSQDPEVKAEATLDDVRLFLKVPEQG